MVWEVAAHDTRVLASALSPDGGTVGTAASDENLKVSRQPCFSRYFLPLEELLVNQDASKGKRFKLTRLSLSFSLLSSGAHHSSGRSGTRDLFPRAKSEVVELVTREKWLVGTVRERVVRREV